MTGWVLALFLSLSARADAPSIVGQWKFYAKIYQGQLMPEPPSAPLQLHFEFTAAGESWLYWWHVGAGDHCSRKGRFAVVGTNLMDEVTWVDPANTPDCADDLDMQPGRKTTTPFYFHGDDLAIRFQLAGEPLDMVWKRVNEGEK